MNHLSALELRLSHEREYLRNARSAGEKQLRAVWIAQIEKEIAHEKEFHADECDLSDDELLAELMA